MTDRQLRAIGGGVRLTRGAFLRRVAGLALVSPTLLGACTTVAPQAAPTSTAAPTTGPTAAPTLVPTTSPTLAPTASPTLAPTTSATVAATAGGASAPTLAATAAGQVVVAGVVLPTFVPAMGPKPDLPSTSPGVDDAYLSFPRASLYKAVQQPPGQGGDVNVLSLSFYPPFTPLEQNPALQEINRQLNATLRLNFAAPTDYLTRFNTTIAGGNLPDLLMLGIIPNAAEFLQSQCADLTSYLSGDAVKDYPNL